ncbi:DUF3316 domain-containing protein [Vibrio sp. T11.5]|uniref:DUF3316 domain-containing protein n=1 Tax=Vibrio sp. T11.5 TaxID=2998836 RepID=UPI0022CD49D3|nr:DUF3316 domain-containing protein [Vibrio sp. T11.5]MDA0119740.1 DUF3316 domain-containing protein [Vibrio sp. T11.5]
MKELVSIATILMITSTAAVAGGYRMYSDTKTVNGESATSKEAAYAQGQDIINDIDSMSSRELTRHLSFKLWHPEVTRSLEIKDSTVTLTEKMGPDGQITYQPVVHVDYSYRAFDRD